MPRCAKAPARGPAGACLRCEGRPFPERRDDMLAPFRCSRGAAGDRALSLGRGDYPFRLPFCGAHGAGPDATTSACRPPTWSPSQERGTHGPGSCRWGAAYRTAMRRATRSGLVPDGYVLRHKGRNHVT